MEERERQARSTVNKYMRFSVGAGLLPLPLLNLAGIAALQLRMLQVLSAQYAIPFSRDVGTKILGALLGALVPASLSGGLRGTAGLVASSMPVAGVAGAIVGGLSLPVFSGAATYAVGKVFIQHFESGGTFLDFEPANVREYFRQQFERGQDRASEAPGESDQGNRPNGAGV